MKCLYCNGNLILTKDVYHADRFGIHLTIDELPVYKCDTCGEILLDTKEAKIIQGILSDLDNSLGHKAA